MQKDQDTAQALASTIHSQKQQQPMLHLVKGNVCFLTQSQPASDTAELLAEMDGLKESRRQDVLKRDSGEEGQEERLGVKTRSRGQGGKLGSSRRKTGRHVKVAS